MSQQVIPHQENEVFSKATGLPAGINAGAVAIEQERAIAEAQGQLVLAKRFPRNENEAYAELMNACKIPAFAAVAFYSVPRAGGAVSGPSIRLAEEIARVYGNFEYGHRELSRDSTKSEIEVYAWDKQKNNRSIRQITVMHTRDTRNGQIPLRDQKDIDDKIANVASKQVRGRILALMPKYLVEAATQECRKTIAGNNEVPLAERVRLMSQAFAKYGVTVKHLEGFLKHPLDETLADEIADLQGVFNSIREGTPPSEFFAAEINADEAAETAAAITESAKAEDKPAPAARPRNAAQAKKQAEPAKAEAKAEQNSKAEPEESKAEPETQPEKSENKPADQKQPDPEPEQETVDDGDTDGDVF